MNDPVPAAGGDRYARIRIVTALDFERIRHSTICVAGAGALGNEVLKNMALYGPRKLVVVDNDSVDLSNLGRCFLFTEEDALSGRGKADAACESLRRINSDVEFEGRECDVLELDRAFFSVFDAVIGCLDNINARLHVNSNCYYAGVPYIDGGLDGLTGRVQVVVPPEGACYQCTLNASHMKVLDRYFSCSGRETNIPRRRVPAEPSVSALIGSIQSLEAAKLLSGKAQGDSMQFYDGAMNWLENISVAIEPGCDNHGEMIK